MRGRPPEIGMVNSKHPRCATPSRSSSRIAKRGSSVGRRCASAAIFSKTGTWADDKGFHSLRQISVDSLRQFRELWPDSPLYATKDLERLRAFFRFCYQAGWIKLNS